MCSSLAHRASDGGGGGGQMRRVTGGQRLSHPGGRDSLAVRRATMAVRGGPSGRHALCAVATAIACTADVLPDIRAALVQTTDRGTFRTALVEAVATAARPEDASGRMVCKV